MPTVVELPNNVEIEFPDGMGYDDIHQTIGRYAKPLGLPTPAQQQMTHQPFVDPYGGLAENLAVGVYESPGQTANLVDMAIGNNPVAQGIVDNFIQPQRTLKETVDQAVNLPDLMSEFRPDEYSASPLLQGTARTAGQIAGDPLELIPFGMFGGKTAKAVGSTAIDDVLRSRAAGKRMTGAVGDDIAKQADSLPMDEASRMARAKEMGAMEGDWYHGSNQSYKKTKNNIGEESFWSTDDPDVASDFATYRRTWPGANVKPVKPMGKYLDIDGRGQNIRNAEKAAERQVPVGDINYGETIEDYARRKGYDGIRFANVTDEIPGSPAYTGQSTLVQTFSPKNIRSKFATFDPAKKNSANLLAGGAAAAVGTGALMNDKEINR